MQAATAASRSSAGLNASRRPMTSVSSTTVAYLQSATLSCASIRLALTRYSSIGVSPDRVCLEIVNPYDERSDRPDPGLSVTPAEVSGGLVISCRRVIPLIKCPSEAACEGASDRGRSSDGSALQPHALRPR